MIVIRVATDGKTLMRSTPCAGCKKCIESWKIKTVYYTTEE
jgi:deoxycytidylate deaminase